MPPHKNLCIVDDNTLINNIKDKNCNESMIEIINRYEKVFLLLVNRFFRKNPNLNFNEMIEDKYIVFNNAVSSFNQNKKIKFSTYLYHVSRWHFLNNNKKKDKIVILENKDIEVIKNNEQINSEHITDFSENHDFLIKAISSIKDKRIEKIFKMRYLGGEGKKLQRWQDIADSLELSIPRVIKMHDKAQKSLLLKFRKKELALN